MKTTKKEGEIINMTEYSREKLVSLAALVTHTGLLRSDASRGAGTVACFLTTTTHLNIKYN